MNDVLETTEYFWGPDGEEKLTITSRRPPRLYSSDCGCTRKKVSAGRWKMTLCSRHTEEYFQRIRERRIKAQLAWDELLGRDE